MTLTYLTDFAKENFYWNEPVYKQLVMKPPLFNMAVLAAFFIVFSVVGIVMFTKSELNK